MRLIDLTDDTKKLYRYLQINTKLFRKIFNLGNILT